MTDESQDKAVICYPWLGRFVWALLISICLGVVHYIYYRSAVLSSLGLVFMVFFVRRRKIEIGDHEIACSPSFGLTRRAKFADIASIKAVTMNMWWGGYVPDPIPGMELQLPDYAVMQIPLDLPNSQEIFDKITRDWERQRSAPREG